MDESNEPQPTSGRTLTEVQEAEAHRLYEDPYLLAHERKALRKKAIVELIAEGCNHREAARGVGIDPSTLCRWRQQDVTFDNECRSAFQVSIDLLRKEAERRAVNGSDKLLMFLLERYAPEQFHIAQKMEHSGAVDLAGALIAARKRVTPPEASSDDPGADLC